MGFFTHKKILVIGGTGTIGKRLIKKLIKEKPEVIRVFSRDEYKQYIMKEQLCYSGKFRYLIGDVRDYERVQRAMQEIDIVFNLAAMKHVPACEYNPSEAIKTNVIGMDNVIKAAMINNVESVIFTSSDKAINPPNSYGATKLLAEKLVQVANFYTGNSRTRFIAVRFGNVMGSRGSVIPLFKKQIKKYKRITITDPNMTRFMMTASQAVKLIMDACENAIGGETFVLKMPIIRLKDLTEVLIEETCKKLNISIEEIKLKTIGIRAGEKRFEELMTKEESEIAFDLGDKYAVIPVLYSNKLCKIYEGKKKAVVGSYNSSNKPYLTKEEVRSLLKKERLI